jgi:type I restriction enzyme, S subunit
MTEWTATHLDQVVALKRGFDLPESTRTPGPYPVLGSSGISGWHNEGPVIGPGVTVGRSGASIGVATYYDGPYWPLNTTLFVEDFKGSDPRYIYYLLHSMDFTRYNSGSAQPSLNRNYIAGIEVSIPPPPEQRAIAEVLGGIDDKIAVNERTAGVCHEIAKLHYENASRDSSLVPLSALVTPILGGTPDRAVANYWGAPNPWASAKDVAACSYGTLISTDEQITDMAVTQTKARPISEGSVILTARGTLGAVARVCQATSFNQSCYAFTAERLPPGILYFTMRSASQQLVGMAQGTVFSTVNMKTFEHIQVASLSSQELGVLESSIAPLLDVIEDRLRENDQLRQLRDVLLPRLMSGAIRIRDGEEIVVDAT